MPFAMRVVFALFGVGAFAVPRWLRRMNARAQSWPSARATVVTSQLGADPHDSDRSILITYRFTVSGREFTSNCVSFSPLPNGQKSKEHLIAQFPPGGDVEVFYDPSNPKRSVLLRAESRSWLWGPVVGAVFVAIAVLAP
jgi:hypothetical protein